MDHHQLPKQLLAFSEEEEEEFKRCICLKCLYKMIQITKSMEVDSSKLSKTSKKALNRLLLSHHQNVEVAIRHALWKLKDLQKYVGGEENGKGELESLMESVMLNGKLEPSTDELEKELLQKKNKKRKRSNVEKNRKQLIVYSPGLGVEDPNEEKVEVDGNPTAVDEQISTRNVVFALSAQQNTINE